MKEFLRKHQQTIINWIVFLGIGRWLVVTGWEWYKAGELWNVVELTFLGHMAILLVLLVIRTRHVGIDRSYFHQAIAVVAFFSGLAFTGPKTTDHALLLSAQVVALAAMALGILTQLNLGRSFGILIARRKIKTNWLYGVIRHPMYFTDILFKVGLLLKMPSWLNLGVFVLGVACYVYRAVLEEKFLSQSDEYREYMKRVRYRFIPGIF
jgi:protein-S-isoprenylcysteine O-methyltransferase Ste14